MASPPAGQSCQNCAYALNVTTAGAECHFDPPQITLESLVTSTEPGNKEHMLGYFTPSWPTVALTDWCGRWSPASSP